MPVINTNMASMAAATASNLKNSTQSAMERLSSGQRINSAREDAAGLAVASALASQASQLSARMAERTAAKTDSSAQAAQSVSDSRALTVAANDALSPFEGSLRRMRDLAVAASAEEGRVLDDTDRQKLQTEFSEIRKQMDQFVGQAEYDGKKLFDGSFSAKIQISSSAGDTQNISLKSLSTQGLGTAGNEVTTGAGAKAAVDAIDKVISAYNENQATIGAAKARLDSAAANEDGRYAFTQITSSLPSSLDGTSENLRGARSRVVDGSFSPSNFTMATGATAGVSIYQQMQNLPQTARTVLSSG